MKKQSLLCSCIFCKEVKSSKGIHTHVERSHFNNTRYSSGYNRKYAQLAETHQHKIDLYLESPSTCLECKSVLEYTKRRNKYCSTKCSAKHTNAKKDYSTFKPGPNKTVTPEEKCCEFCKTKFFTLKKQQRFCSKRCAILHKNAPLRANRTAWQNYRADCQFRFSIKNYPDEFNFSLLTEHGWYKAANKGNNLNGVSRDHMVSCRYGFDNNLPVEHIRHPANCCLLVHNENVSKHKNNSITYEELLNRISEWDKKYPPNSPR